MRSQSLGLRSIALAIFGALLASLVIAVGAGAAGTGAKPGGGHAKAAGAIVSPRPGQRIDDDDLKVVVRAGPDGDDIRARLNGVSIAGQFLVDDAEDRRYLDASLSDGLRRGRNKLVVWVKRPDDTYRRSSVDFDVVDRDPMAAAGLDIRATAGAPVQLDGELLRPGSGPASRIDWRVLSAPPHSRLLSPDDAGGRRPFSGGDTLHPTFHPDAIGTYTVAMTARTGAETTTDLAKIYVVPPIPMITLDTAVPPSAGEPRPAIEIGGNVLRAPYLRTDGKAGSYSGTAGEVSYKAVWQIVALQRSTTMLLWNRTYGVCHTPKTGPYTCLLGPGGVPVQIDLAAELAALKEQALIVAASHPSGGPGMEWDAPDDNLYVTNNLGGIGFPGRGDKKIGAAVAAAKAGEMAGVGVPGLKPGEGTISATGTAGLNGYLVPDSNSPPHYHYIPPQRVPFDTRAAHECGASECTLTQQIGGKGGATVKGSVGPGRGGYLVSSFDPLTLKPLEHKVFVTATGGKEPIDPAEPAGNPTGPGQQALDAMQKYVEGLGKGDSIVIISSIHGPGQSPAILFTQNTGLWKGLLGAVTSVGATRENFVGAASTPGSDYTLIGAGGLAEGEGQEAVGPGASLRGKFVPDNDSAFQPRSVSEATGASDLLMRIIMDPPGGEPWPYESNPKVMKAMSAIGEATTLLGSRPRFTYWNKLSTPALAQQALSEVEKVKEYPSGEGFSKAAFEKARQELIKELEMVQTTRAYMAELAQPNGDNEVWQLAGKVSTELKDDIERLERSAKASAEYLEIIGEMLEIGALIATDGASEGVKQLAKFLESAAIAAETGQTLMNVDYDGSEGQPSVVVEGLRLGEALVQQAKDNERAFTRFGDIIVSDWAKLQVVGKYGGCNPEGSCGKHKEYAALAHTPEMGTVAEAATIRSFDREIYGRLVPLAFPIWDTGSIERHQKEMPTPSFQTLFYCYDIGHHYPFEGAPEQAYSITPEELFPKGTNSPTDINNALLWEVHLSVARSGLDYSWPQKSMVERMFNPLPLEENEHPNLGGLGMSPGQFMREGERIGKYEPTLSCGW